VSYETDTPSAEPKGMRLSDAEIVAFIRDRESRAERPEINDEQAEAMDAYLRRPYGNEEEGRSQVISSDVFDTVEGILPALIEPFIASSDLVQFNPNGPEDEDAAKQETELVNWVVTQQNDAPIQLQALGKAGLLQKNGVVKWWWDKTRRVTISTYRGVSMDELAAFLNDPGVEIIGLNRNAPAVANVGMTPTADASQQAMMPPGMPAAPQAAPQQAPPEETFDVRLRERREDGYARYAVVPPEELLVIGRDPNIQKASFIQHRTRVTLSDLREMGYEVEDSLSDAGEGDVTNSATYTARTTETDSFNQGADDSVGDPSMREVWYRESYCYLDLDGDGIAELRLICQVGSTVLAKDEAEEIPFGSWTPYLQLFQYDGRCPADEAMEFQEVKTTLWRQTLDNIYTINNNRTFAGRKVNLDDLLDNQIAGVVRVDSDNVQAQVQSAQITPIGAITMPMIEYADAAKENRTGYSRYNQGSADLGNQKTLGEVQLVTGAANKRTLLMIRNLANMAIVPLMLGIHGLLRRHATKALTIRLRGQWVSIDPTKWGQRLDMTVSVGLGTMDKQQELGTQQEILKIQAGLAPAGFVTPENQYNAAAKFVELTGEKNADKYFTHPDKMPQKAPPDPMSDPKVAIEVARHQLDAQKFEKESAQKDRALDQADRALDQVDQKQGIESDNAMLDALERHHKLQLETEAHAREMAAPHPQELAAGSQALQAQQQEHQQGVDQAQLDQSQQQLEAQQAEPAEEGEQ
jgi:hypothetical protein